MKELKFNLNQILNLFNAINKNSCIISNIMNTNSNLETPFFKKGGKSKIYIKKVNRGKFTEYCGGTVTEECIKRGKNSSNPKIRKRATFADNARHFKHLQGGTMLIKDDKLLDKLKYDEWNKLSLLDKLNRRFNIAKLYMNQSPSLPNLYNAASAIFGEYDPENPYLITGDAPVVNKKLSVANIHDNGIKLTKKVNTAVKHTMSYLDGDARHVMSGRSRNITARRDRARSFLTLYRSNSPEYKEYFKLVKKKAKYGDDKAMVTKIKKLMNEILDNLINQGYIK